MKFAIFNGFEFHYETFGVFLDFIKSYNHQATVFSETHLEMGWLNFYKKIFGDCIVIRNKSEFNAYEFNKHDYVILPTDDDWHFNDSYMDLPNAKKKVIAYDHSKNLRRSNVVHHVGTRPYITAGRPELPVLYSTYPMMSKNDKYNILLNSDKIYIAAVGGSCDVAGTTDIVKLFNLLKQNNKRDNFKLIYMRRYASEECRKLIADTDIDHEFIESPNAETMIDILKKCQYCVFADTHTHIYNSCSGAIGMALSTGCTMIMPREYNTDYKFKNAIYFEDSPILQKIPDLNLIFEDHTQAVDNNHRVLQNITSKKVAIFNGFNFHYETIGVFLYTLKRCGCKVTVFTNRGFETGWFDFYKAYFGDFFQSRYYLEFTEEEFNNHDFTIVTTDDDFNFKDEFMNLPNAQNKVLLYDHFKENRRKYIKNHVGTRPFTTAGRPDLQYIYACYPIVSFDEKLETCLENDKIIVTLVGGPDNLDKYFNYLRVNNDISKIKFYFIRRWTYEVIENMLKSLNIDYECLIGIDTLHMFEVLKRSQYLMFTDDAEHTYNSSSGAIGLALSTGCTMIMPREYNTDYKFKNAIYFEDYPTLVKGPRLDVIFNERDEVIANNINIINSFLLCSSSESS